MPNRPHLLENRRPLPTMSRRLVMTLLGLLAIGGPAIAGSTQSTSFGEGSGDGEITAIADILAAPETWDGREVRVQGKVTGVCQKKGCWLMLSDAQNHALRVKVEDDVIAFPKDADGSVATARGKVVVHEMSREQYEAWERHLAADRGESFDPGTLGDPPYRRVEIAGVGAEIGHP